MDILLCLLGGREGILVEGEGERVCWLRGRDRGLVYVRVGDRGSEEGCVCKGT